MKGANNRAAWLFGCIMWGIRAGKATSAFPVTLSEFSIIRIAGKTRRQSCVGKEKDECKKENMYILYRSNSTPTNRPNEIRRKEKSDGNKSKT